MQYRILGPLEVSGADGVVDLGSPKQRAVLAALVLEPGRVVAAERIVDQVWGDEPPANVAASLQAYISNLRRALRDDTATSPIVRQSPGYRLDGARDRVDAQQFLILAADARSAVEAHDWSRAADTADAALRLWRGEVLADLRDEGWVQLAAVPLDERRAQCSEDLVTALLGAERTVEAVTAARALHAADPLRERAAWLYLVALHRDGRTTEALDEHRALLRRLDEELGLAPGPALLDLQSAMLRHEPDLAVWPETAARARSTAPAGAAPTGAAPAEPAPAADDPPAGSAIVGRHAELALADAALEEAAQGVARWLVFSGPAGIGKTRLAEEVLARAAARGARVLRALCPDDDGVPPWWPVAQLVRALGGSPEEVLAQDPDAEADRARFAVYERVRALIESTALAGPLALLVDDVQWADPSSLGLLTHLAFALDAQSVAVVLTARAGVGGSDLRRLFDAAARRPGTRTVTVPPLGGAEVGELVQHISGDEVGRAEAAVLLTRTGGNPFFVSEYARLPRAERETGEIPLAVRSVLGRRLDALDAGTLQVLRTAAVIGDVLDIGLLRQVTRLDIDELADLLDEAADERIVLVAPGSRSYAFAHGLLRDELLAGMGDARRQRVHARVADAIGPGGGTEELVRRAGHLMAALPLADVDEVFEACRAAALDADARFLVDSAAHWWEAAVSSYDQLPAARCSAEQRDELVRLRLRALIRAGRGQTVYDTVDTEMRGALSGSRPASIGMLCSILIRSVGAWPWAAFGQDPGPLLATLQRAEPQVVEDTAAHARVLAALAVGSVYDPDGTAPDTLSRRALEIAEALADPDVLADALLGRCLAFSGIAGRARECLGLLDRLAELPHGYAEVDAVIRHGLLTMVHGHLGNMAAVVEHTRLGVAGSDALRLPTSRVQFRLTESLVALWEGRFVDAEWLFRDGNRMREQTELYFGWARMALVVSRWKQGRLLTLIDEPSEEPISPLELICLAVARGDTDDADERVQRWLDQDGPVIWTSGGDWTLLAAMIADAGLVRHARRMIELLRPLEGLVALVGQLSAVGPVSLTLARLHHLLGEDDVARRDAAAARAVAERSGGVPSLLRCRLFACELGDADDAELDGIAADAEAAGVLAVAVEARALAAQRSGADLRV